MPKQSKFLLNIICGAENTTEEIRGKIQCISSGQSFIFTNIKEMHDFIRKEICLPDNEENCTSGCAEDLYPEMDPAKGLKQPGKFI